MGLFEILIIATVTLLLVGPQRMPEAVRSVALNIGRAKRAVQSAQSEIEKHIDAGEIRRQLRNEEIMAKVEIARKKKELTIQANKKTESQESRCSLPSPSTSKPTTADGAKSRTVDSL